MELSPGQRLAANPRRRKVAPENRKRVARACNRCNVKRIKCSGQHPCSACEASAKLCQYSSVEEKVTIYRAEYEELKSKAELLQQGKSPQSVQNVVDDIAPSLYVEGFGMPSPWNDSIGTQVSAEVYVPGEANTPDEESASREGRVLQDPDGIVRFLGESSGATFLDQLREFMAKMFPLAFNGVWPGFQNQEHSFIAALGKYQTQDSQPLLIADTDPHKLPSRTEARLMLADLCYFAQDASGDFESGGIYYWFDMANMIREYQGKRTSNLGGGSDTSAATWNAAFAVACQINPASSPRNEGNLGENFLTRSKILLGNPLEVATLGDVRTLALLAYYLLGLNRRDAAHIYVSVAMHVLIVHGVHRGWLVDEQGKRTFWTVYVLDRSLSCLMGRPPMIPDEAIKLDVPRDLSGLPTASGLRAHVELSRISNYIVSNIYDVARKPSGGTQSASYVHSSLKMLSDWLKNLPPELQIPEDCYSDDRACIELHMTYNQLLILTVRPTMLVAVKRAATDRLINQLPLNQENSRFNGIETCYHAARRNIRLCRTLLELGHSPRLLQANLHNLFNASVILQLTTLFFDSEGEVDLMDLNFAVNVLESDTSGNRDYARDCAKVLSDLRSLTLRIRGIDDDVVPRPAADASNSPL